MFSYKVTQPKGSVLKVIICNNIFVTLCMCVCVWEAKPVMAENKSKTWRKTAFFFHSLLTIFIWKGVQNEVRWSFTDNNLAELFYALACRSRMCLVLLVIVPELFYLFSEQIWLGIGRVHFSLFGPRLELSCFLFPWAGLFDDSRPVGCRICPTNCRIWKITG